MAYLTPRDAKYRPYVLVGPTMVVYKPTGGLEQPKTGPLLTFGGSLKTKIEPGFTIGVGVKMPLTRYWGTRIDVRYLWTPDPNYGLPNAPSGPGSAYIRPHHGENGIQFTSELSSLFGWHYPPPPPAPAPPPPPPPPPPAPPALTVSAIQGARDACPGDNIRLTVTASGGPSGATPTYQWLVNNQPAPGGTGPAFNVPTANGAGTQAISVTVSSGGATASATPVNVTVRPAGPPTIQFTVSPTTINYGDRLPLSATAAGNQCTNPVNVRYTASEGTITGTTFDSTGVSFDQSNRLRQQSKTIRLTATATDAKNQTATANANVTVNFKPAASRQDIVFPNRSSRVNNAAKRYLLETLTPQLRNDPNATVILVGHRDMSETGRPSATLDTQRVLNAAAVISAGKGVCPSLDLSRVQVAYAGADQATPPMPFGDASVKERAGQATTDQRSQFRRVEVWFVPGGADAPSIPGLMPAPVKDVQAKGCPR